MKPAALHARMAIALAMLACALVLFADAMFGVLPARDAGQRAGRTALADALAIQATVMLESGDAQAMTQALTRLRERNPQLESAAVRRVDGAIAAITGEHDAHWRAPRRDQSDMQHIVVPLHAGGERWGQVELAFTPSSRGPIAATLASPIVVLLGLFATLGVGAFWLYLRRALQHLNPGAVIPDRVRGAFDVMTQAVFMLDARGKLLLWNKSAERLSAAHGAPPTLGRALGQAEWLAAALPTDAALHPWSECIEQMTPVRDFALDAIQADGTSRHLMIQCAPVIDDTGRARGCLVTIDDVSEVQRTNERLRATLVELAVARAENQQKDAALEERSQRDALTGCLHRSGFNAALDSLAATATSSSAAPEPFAMLRIDLDGLDALRARRGRDTADAALTAAAQALAAGSRATDIIGRLGEDAFCVALPNIELKLAAQIGARLRDAVIAVLATHGAEQVVIHVGVAGQAGGLAQATQVLAAAEASLTRARISARRSAAAAPIEVATS